MTMRESGRPPLSSNDSVLILSGAEVRALLRPDALIALMSQAFRLISSGRALVPLRWIVDLPDGNGLGMMPGLIEDPRCFGVKVTAVYPGNFETGHPSHQGVVLLFETEHGRPIAFIHGGEVTAARTAAASAAATDILALRDADELGILGYGEQAERHLEAMLQIRPIRRVRVWGRSEQRAHAFAETAQAKYNVAVRAVKTAREAVEGIPLICTVTASSEPVLHGEWIARGAHLNVVGSSAASSREVDVVTVQRCRIYADFRRSAEAQGGEILAARAAGAAGPDVVYAEIGEVLLGLRPGRQSADDVTMFKSLGVSVEDLITAMHLVEAAAKCGTGMRVPF
jgi:alanine dehydrogenase